MSEIAHKIKEVARFHKVSFEQFFEDSKKAGFVDDDADPELVRVAYDRIKLPTRATKGSAGYDFYLPYPFSLYAMRNMTIPTGINVQLEPGWMLMLVPRSGLGTKYGMRLVNTIGVIDSDYFFAKNEGHILAGITVSNNMCLTDGDRFAQGIIVPYGITKDDCPLSEIREGGFGSTGVK